MQWICEIHNAVNENLGKPQFDCDLCDLRWRRTTFGKDDDIMAWDPDEDE